MLLLASFALSFSAPTLRAATHLVRYRHTRPSCMADETPAIPAPLSMEGKDVAAVTGAVQPVAAVPRMLTLEQEINELYETLDLYDERVLQLEAAVSLAQQDGEISVQKVGAVWIDRLAQAKANAATNVVEAAAAEAKAVEADAKAVAAETRAQEAEARAAAAEAKSQRLEDGLSQMRALIDSLTDASPKAADKKVATKPEDKSVAKAQVARPETKELEAVKPEAKKPDAKKPEAEKPEAEIKEKPPSKQAQEVAAAKEAEAGNEKTAETKVVEEEKVNEDLPKEEAPKGEPPVSMQTKYAERDAKNMKKGAEETYAHVAQFDWNALDPALPHDQLVAMSQLPETPLDNFMPDFAKIPLGELRLKLGSMGESTKGLRSELVARYEERLRLERSKQLSWDPATASWVPVIV